MFAIDDLGEPSDENIVERNSISNNFTGISVVGTNNLFERNSIVGSLIFGIFFNPGGGGNAYRNNMLRGNPVENTAGTGTDEGGNIL